jgi:hypothetical protein
VSLGVIPGYGGTQRLPQWSEGRAMEMIMTRMVTADEGIQNWISKPRGTWVELWNSVMGGTKKSETLLWRSNETNQLMPL